MNNVTWHTGVTDTEMCHDTVKKEGIMKHITLVFAGNIFAAGLGFLAVLIISRKLTVSDFGLFNMAISAMSITSHLSTLGMDNTMIKFASSYLVIKRKVEADSVLRVIFLVRIIVSSLLAIILFNVAELLSIKIFHHSSLIPLFKLAAFGSLAASLLTYLRSVLYTYQLFKRSVTLQLFVDFGKLFIVVVLIFSLKMNVFTAVATFAFIPLLGIVFEFRQMYHRFFFKKKPIKNLLNQLFSYGKWLFVSNICRLILPYIGIFMISKMLSSEAAGIYGLALNLTYIFPIIIYSLQSVLLPKVSRFRERAQFERYVKGSLRISCYMGMMVVPLLFFSHDIILFLFGSRYLDSIPVFNWLLLSYIALTTNTPVKVALYAMNKPYVVAIVDMVSLIAMVSGCYLLITSLGILAPALLVLVINVSALGFLSLYTLKNIRRDVITFQDMEIIESYQN